MGVRQKLIVEDSFDGKDLPEDTQPITVTVGRKSWDLYLSDANAGKFYDQLEKWTKNEPEKAAETFAAARKSPARSAARTDPEQTKRIREWLQSTGYLYKGKQISDRGRIPQEALDAYSEAH